MLRKVSHLQPGHALLTQISQLTEPNTPAGTKFLIMFSQIFVTDFRQKLLTFDVHVVGSFLPDLVTLVKIFHAICTRLQCDIYVYLGPKVVKLKKGVSVNRDIETGSKIHVKVRIMLLFD